MDQEHRTFWVGDDHRTLASSSARSAPAVPHATVESGRLLIPTVSRRGKVSNVKNLALSVRALAIARFLLLAASIPTLAGSGGLTPAAVRGHTVEKVYGVTMQDPYRWMEGENNAAFAAWLKTQALAGRARLDASPLIEKWRARLRIAGATTATNKMQHRVGDRLFYMHLAAGRQGVLRVQLETGKDRVLFDPNSLTGDVHASVTGYSVSPGWQAYRYQP